MQETFEDFTQIQGFIKDNVFNQEIFEKGEQKMTEKQGQTNFMEKFIQQKYSQVTDLQKYLIEELQFIQSSKKKQKQIQKLVSSTLIPITKELQEMIQGVQLIVKPLQSLMMNYVEIVAQKAKDLLMDKQKKCQRQEKELERIKMQNQKLKQRLEFKQKKIKDSYAREESYSPFRKDIQTEIILFNRARNTEKDYCQSSLENKSKSIKKEDNLILKSKKQVQRSPLRSSSQTKLISQKQSECKIKNQENYGNALLNKTLNISYKRQKSFDQKKLFPSNSKSKFQKGGNLFKVDVSPLQTRKDYIKQKIQTIKQKAENHYQKLQ